MESKGWTLGVETTAGEGSLALLKDGLLVAERALSGARGAGLVPAAKAILEEANLKPSDLSLVAVDIGPGSFTGTRVGVIFAKTLAYATGCGLAPVSSLEARAIEAKAAAVPGVLAVVLDARRGRFYAAAFRGGERLFGDALFTQESLRARVPAGATWLGDAAAGLARPGEAVLPDRPPSAATVARLGEAAPRLTPFALAPAYLRMVEAQEKRASR